MDKLVKLGVTLGKIGTTLGALSAIITIADQIYTTWQPAELPAKKD
jgi:hypothetical protein